MIVNNNHNVQLFKLLRGLKMLANISQPSLTAPHTFKRHWETVEAAFSTVSWNQEYPAWIKSCYSQYWHLHLLLILAGAVAASNIWKFEFQTQAKSCHWSTAPLAPSKKFPCLCQSSADSAQQESQPLNWWVRTSVFGACYNLIYNLTLQALKKPLALHST